MLHEGVLGVFRILSFYCIVNITFFVQTMVVEMFQTEKSSGFASGEFGGHWPAVMKRGMLSIQPAESKVQRSQRTWAGAQENRDPKNP